MAVSEAHGNEEHFPTVHCRKTFAGEPCRKKLVSLALRCMVVGSGATGKAKRKRGLALFRCESVPPAARRRSSAGSLTETAAVVVARMPGNLDLIRVGARPATVHSCAKAGDVEGLSMKLRENPALLNAPNDVMCQTPLHIAAGNNNVEIMRCLFEWRGPEDIELEAKNMYGESPLHVASKNNSGDAVKLLLERGSLLQAKTSNGMTPLHLAVWHSTQAQDWSTVKILLEHNADCFAKDNEGMTPLDHLPQGSSYEKLREFIRSHIEEQTKRRALAACNEVKFKMSELEVALAKIVGLNDVKMQIRKWAKGMLLDEKRRALGLKVAKRRVPHMAFLGNPGTGKTMVARVLGKLLHMVGILPTDKVTEVQRTDLVGEFVGHTGPKTRRKIQEAEGGILFVDEAYRLIPMQKSDDKDYGIEALEEIMSVMDSGKIVVILAGYSEPMNRVISANEGFCRRVTKFFHFSDFSSAELAQITHIKMSNQAEDSVLYGFRLDSSCSMNAIAGLIERETVEKQRKEMNGGLVDPMLVNARENLDLRLDFDSANEDNLVSITLEDLQAGLRSLSK